MGWVVCVPSQLEVMSSAAEFGPSDVKWLAVCISIQETCNRPNCRKINLRGVVQFVFRPSAVCVNSAMWHMRICWEAVLLSWGKRRRTQKFRHPKVVFWMYSENMGEHSERSSGRFGMLRGDWATSSPAAYKMKRQSCLVDFFRFSETLYCTGSVIWWC